MMRDGGGASERALMRRALLALWIAIALAAATAVSCTRVVDLAPDAGFGSPDAATDYDGGSDGASAFDDGGLDGGLDTDGGPIGDAVVPDAAILDAF
jgi:hypothetical protein